MENNAIFPKVTADLFMAIGNWILRFLGVMFIVQIIETVITFFNGSEMNTYFNAVFIAANIAMFVIGIISTNFLPHYVEYGVSKKDYFKGAFLAAIGLSIALPIIAFLVSKLGEFIVGNIDRITLKQPVLNSAAMEIDGNIISDIVQSFIMTPHIDPNNNWALAIAVLSLNIFFFYLIGWFIGACFYRFHVIAGLGSILLGVIFITLKDSLLRIVLDLPLPNRYIVLDFLPASASMVGLILLLVLLAWLIRSLTKKIPVKI